jgi:glycosyltransferase involved in cell wall biosynthesis
MLRLDGMMPDIEWVLYSRRSIDLNWPSSRWRVVVDEHPFWRRLPGVLWVKWRLGRLARNIDLFWAPATLTPAVKVPLVVTVNDLNHRLVPKTMPLVNRLAYRRWFDRDVKRADAVVAISQGTAQRLAQFTGRTVDAVAVPGGKWRAMEVCKRPASPLGTPYLLAVGTNEPRKNLGTLVRAVELLKDRGEIPRHVLVLVGPAGWGRRVAATHPWLRFLGYVPDDGMAALLANADVLVQPSIYEGYGMPAAEASAFGTPVVANDIPELREASGNAGIYTAPDAESLASGILEALSRPRPGPVPLPSWEEAAAKMRQVFEACLQETVA